MLSNLGGRMRRVERAAVAAARAELAALWDEFTDDELEVAARTDDAAIRFGVLDEAQRAVVDKWLRLGGERLSRQLWVAMTPSERAAHMQEVSGGQSG